MHHALWLTSNSWSIAKSRIDQISQLPIEIVYLNDAILDWL